MWPGMAAAGAALAAVTALAVAGVAERAAVAASFTVLGHLHWLWIPAALLLESASMAAFAIMLRRLLAAGGASVGVRPMLATAYAANAVSVSVPLAGPATGHGLHVPPLHPAGRGCPAGRLVAAGRRGDLLGRGGPYRGRRRAGVGEHPGHSGHRSRRRARRSRPRRGGRGRAPPAAARRARAASRMDAPAGIPDAAPACRRSRPDHPGLGAATGFTPASPVRLDNGDRPGPGQLARRRGGPRREHPRHRRHRPLARSSAGLRLGHRRAKPQHHARRPGGHRGIAQPGPGRDRAGYQPGPGGGAALPPRQFLAGRTGRVAGRVLAAASPSPPRSRSFAAHRHEQDAAMAANLRTTDTPAGLGAHELVLLHGQPGSPADWQLVAGRLPAQLHAVAADRPGYGSSQLPAGGFAANARAVLDDLDSRGITRAVLVGHSYGGGVALSAASLAPGRVEAVVLLASVGPGCVTGWDRLLAAPGAGRLCAQVAWRLTPWMARARLAGIARRRGRPLRAGRARQLAGLGPCGPRTPPAVAHLPDRATRPAARARRAGARYRVGPGAGSRARRPQGHRGSLRNRPPAGYAPCRMLACSSSRARVITCPGEPPRPSPTRSWRSWPRPRSPTSRSLSQP